MIFRLEGACYDIQIVTFTMFTVGLKNFAG